jgi:hypothetical protein
MLSAVMSEKTEQEWKRLQRLLPGVKLAWEKGQAFFQDDLTRATTSPEEMEYLSLFDFAIDCYAYISAKNTYPHNPVLQAWGINGYMQAWRRHFLAESEREDI